jgi:serine/threonine protein kinase
MSGFSLKPNAGIDSSRPAAERYKILGRIASGGMAEIYLARMMTTAGVEREVVLKRLMPELQSDHEFVQMFYDEARIASQMRHPNIVQIYELGELDGSLFISMELLRGVNLRDLLARVHEQEQTIPVALGVRIMCGACEALAYAHRFTDPNGRLLNVVHRDVSPQNIIVTFDGTVKLVDFGVAKAEGRLHQTRAGLIKGKFAYMSPEQISGGKVDGRSDIFALGEVFYELLLKRHPFYASTDMDVLRAILDVDPPHPVSLEQTFPPELGSILMRSLKKNPGDRYTNASAMHDALEMFLQEQRTPATTIMLGRFARELFSDRVETEQRARESGDDDLLIEAMTAGRADGMPAPRKKSAPRLSEPEEHNGALLLPSSVSGQRDQVVEIAKSESHDPAEEGSPAFIAHSGYTDPGVRKKHFQSQVRKLFEDPAEVSAPNVQALEDANEMPTMLGNYTIEQLQEMQAQQQVQRVEVKKPKTRDDLAIVEPAKQSSGPMVRRSPQSGSVPVLSPSKDKPISRPNNFPVTPRSRTVLQGGESAEPRSDRWGLLLFVAGLGALLGAIVYAAVLYTGAHNPVMRLVVSSTPTGAMIILNGAETGVQTPQIFQNIPSDRETTLELRLPGYEPYIRKLPPAPELGELIIDWRFKPLPGTPPLP